MFSITDEHFNICISLIEMLITEMYSLHIKIEHSFFFKN